MFKIKINQFPKQFSLARYDSRSLFWTWIAPKCFQFIIYYHYCSIYFFSTQRVVPLVISVNVSFQTFQGLSLRRSREELIIKIVKMVIWWDINYPYKAMQDTPSHWYKCISVTSKSARLMVNSEDNLKIFVDIFIYIRFKSLVSQSHQRWFFPIISTRILFTESPKTLTGRSRDNSFLDVQKTLHLKRSIKERLVYFLCFLWQYLSQQTFI